MARKINVKINVKALDRNKLFVGEKGTYANITLIETPGGQYGDWMVVEDQTAKERSDKKNSTILGNGKNYGWGSSDTTSSDPSPNVSSDDISF